jgi:S1-C subfamily serine protease
MHRSKLPLSRAFALIAMGMASASAPLDAQSQSPKPVIRASSVEMPARAPRYSIADLSKTVVTLFIASPSGSASGSGVVVDGTGVIATAAHVIAGGISAKVRLSTGEMMPIEGVLAVDEKLDIALLRVAGFGMPTATLGNSDSLSIGQRLIAIGAPLGLEATVSDGLLSSIRLYDGQRLLQISIPVSHGSSGGPIFNEQGEVVGLVVSGVEEGGAQNLNFAVPINVVRGRLALARTAPLRPFAEAVASVSSDPTRMDSTGAILNGGSPDGEVNQKLGLDFNVLRGVEAAGEYKDERGLKNISYTRYVVGSDGKGNTTIERINSRRVRVKVNAFESADALVHNSRTMITLGTMRQTQEWTEVIPQMAGVEAYTATVTISGRQFQAVDSRSRMAGTAPVGVLTPSMLLAAVASLPDSLPAEVFISMLNVATAQTTATRITFGKRDTIFVTVAQKGSGCGAGRRTKDVKLPIVWANFSYGTSNEEMMILQTRPHVRVDGMECVQLTQPQNPS